jgi:hypothetical protein
VTYWVEVEGVPQPAELAGHTALEFCNTWAGWTGGHERDYLESYDHLAVWQAGRISWTRTSLLGSAGARPPT